jgi:hypothetical protein
MIHEGGLALPIWSLGLLLGMVPADQDEQSGHDAPHLDRTRVAQDALNRTPRTAAFRARWGPLVVRWDERNSTPRALLGPGLPAIDTSRLVADLALIGGVDPRSLIRLRVTGHGDRETWVFEQQHQGAPIDGGGVVVHIQNGRIALVLASLHLPKGLGPPEPGEVLLPDHSAVPLAYTWVRREEHPEGTRFRDRSGNVVHSWSTVMFLDLETEERTVGDPLLRVPAREVTVSDASSQQLTDDLGTHSLGSPIDVRLEGPNLLLREDQTPIEVPGLVDGLLVWGQDMPAAASTVQHHFHVAWDWLEDRRPSHTWLDRQVRASILVPGSCNAYYTNGTINFYGEDDRCADFGRIADVVYHEIGHGIHHYVIEEGTFAGDISEGSSDFVSATILDDPILAPEATGPGTFIREIETDRVYPDDATGSSHNDGLIWASFLWNLRGEWRESYGVLKGTRMVDELFLQTLSYGPTMTDLTEAVIAADDDDADITNGTPHDCELIDLLNHHGLGPGSLGLVLFEHDPIGAQGSFVDGYAVEFSLEQVLAECGDLDPESVRVVYAIDQPLSAGVPFDPAVLIEVPTSHDGNTYSGVIPRQFPGSRVSYGMRWSSGDGQTTALSYDDRRDGLYDFFVGDRQSLWCADFESGWDGVITWNGVYGEPVQQDWVDEWQRGAPLGQTWNATGPWAGSSIIGTALDAEGLYSAHNGQQARTADLRLSQANPRMALLSARRWLTVEDGKYDQAVVWVDSDAGREILWANPVTEGGSRHVLDVDWTLFDLDLRPYLDWNEDLRFAFALDSDGGLEYGGWALDELCVVTLADEEGHYRVRDLQASDDLAEVQIDWTQPMITPLSATTLVRKADGFPLHATDGQIVDTDLAPVPGGHKTVLDDDVEPGQVYFYAVFAAPSDAVHLTDVVSGENGDQGGVLGVESEDSALLDSGDSAEPEKHGGVGPPPGVYPVEERDCGCQAAPAMGHGAWLLAVILGWRRRR